VHDSLEKNLSFPSYYGRNFHALLDCLRDLNVPVEGGVAIVFRAFDVYSSSSNDARMILDIFGRASRYFLLTGRRFLVLVQSDDPLMHYEGLACVSTIWNRREWLNKDRGL
jgi:RNAse (barnase) inhibitor barstar